MAEPIKDRIVAIMKAPDPPQTMNELIERVGAKRPTVYHALSMVLSRGRLVQSDLPWRKERKAVSYKPIKTAQQTALEQRLIKIIDANDKDRVNAIKALMELRQIGQETTGPPAYNDEEGIITALSAQLLAAGKRVSDIAWRRAFDERHDILIDGSVSSEVPVGEVLEVGPAPPS